MRHEEHTSEHPSEWEKFLSFTIANPKIPIVLWFYGILIKALTLMWLGYGAARGLVVLSEHGPPETFLMVLFQLLAAVILYFLGDGLCHGERLSVYGLATLCAVAIIIAIWSSKMGYRTEPWILTAAIVFLFVPPVFSGFKNIRLLH